MYILELLEPDFSDESFEHKRIGTFLSKQQTILKMRETCKSILEDNNKRWCEISISGKDYITLTDCEGEFCILAIFEINI